MKRLLLSCLFFLSISLVCSANEMTEDYFDIAKNYCANGDYHNAILYLDKIIAIEPNNKDITTLRNGLLQIQQSKNSSFIIQKSNTVKQSLLAKQKGNKAFEREALTLGTDYWSYYFLGEYYRQNKDYNQAISYLIKAVNAKPQLTLCYLQIAICHYELKNYSQALTYVNQYLKLHQEDDFAYALKSKILVGLNENSNALSEILTAIALENSLEYRFLEGKILYKLKRYIPAKTKLEALTTEFQNAELYKYIGLCEAELGNYADAIIMFDKSLILSDDDKELNKKYNEIKIKVENGQT